LRKTKRTEITVETERVLVVRRRRASRQAWCDACAGQVETVLPEQAALIARVSVRTIYRWVEDGRLHFLETSSGNISICLNSLPENSANH
jgi:hypothetical protein